jgi:hypothetical protein
MAERVVLLGPQDIEAKQCAALEMTALDADALREGGVVRVRLAQFSGDVRNATVLDLTDEYINRHGSLEKAWEQIDGFLAHMRSVRRVRVKTPIPLWNGGRRTYTDDHRLVPETGDLARVLKDITLSSRDATLAADQNVLIDGVSDDGTFVTIKWRDAEGTHLLAVAATEVEAIP